MDLRDLWHKQIFVFMTKRRLVNAKFDLALLRAQPAARTRFKALKFLIWPEVGGSGTARRGCLW